MVQDNIKELVSYINEHTDTINLLNNNITNVRNSVTELHPVLSSFRKEFDVFYILKRKFNRDINLLASEHLNEIEQLKAKDLQIKRLNITQQQHF